MNDIAAVNSRSSAFNLLRRNCAIMSYLVPSLAWKIREQEMTTQTMIHLS